MSSGLITLYARDLPVLSQNGLVKSKFDEEKIYTIFGQYANVDPENITVKTGETVDGTPCAYAIVELSNQNDVNRLLEKLNYKTIKNLPIHLVLFDEDAQKVLRNDDGNSLLIHDINASMKVEELRELFRPFGDIIDCEIPFGCENIAYVLFRKSEDAKCAMKNLNGKAPTGAVPIKIEVDHSNFFTKMFVLPNENNNQSTTCQQDVQDNKTDSVSNRNVDLEKENERLRKENAELKEKLGNYEQKVNN